MKKIITALNNPYLNNELKKEKKFNVINKDIIYKEGIIEILEKNKNINTLIINYDLDGNLKIDELIKKIKKINEKIELIFILEKEDIEKEKILKKYNIKKIYYNNKMTKKDLIKKINENNNEENLKEEIEKLKKIIKEKELIENNKEKNMMNKIIKFNHLKKMGNKFKNKMKNNKKNPHKVNLHKIENIENAILIYENQEMGIIHISLSILSILKQYYNKILLIDLKIDNEDIHILFNKKYIKKKINNKIKNVNLKKESNIKKTDFKKYFFLKLYNNIKLLTMVKKYIELNMNKNEENKIEKIINLIRSESKKYDFLVIEISEKNNYDLNNKLIKIIKNKIIIIYNNYENIKKLKKEQKNLNGMVYLYYNKKIKKEFNNKINYFIIKNVLKKIKIIKKINKKIIKKIIKNKNRKLKSNKIRNKKEKIKIINC